MSESNANTLEEIKRLRAAIIAAERRAEEAEERARQERAARIAEHAARIAAEENAREDAANFQEALRREKEERQQEVQGQTLHQYLAQTFRVAALHFPRLLTSPVVPKKPKMSKTSKTTNFTTGRTDIGGKHYPLRLCPWPEFLQLHEEAWARIEAGIGQQRQLPSVGQVKATEQAIVEELPSEFLTSEYFLTEHKTSNFIHEALQKPTSKIFNAYLAAIGTRKIVFFDNRAAAQRSQAQSSPGSSNVQKPPVKTHPDCVLLRSTAGIDDAAAEGVMDDDGDDGDDSTSPISRFAIGEHKPARSLRASAVARILQGPMPEDYIDQLAKMRCRAGGSPSQDARDSTAADVSASVLPATTKSSVPPSQVYFAYALTQAYHYLLMSGLEFGYLASGGTLTFLRIPEDDCTTLLYHVALFPDYTKTGQSSPTIDPEATDVTVFHQLAIAQLCSLCLLANEAGDRPRSVLWRAEAHQMAPTFPRRGDPPLRDTAISQPPSIFSDHVSTSSSEPSSRSNASSLGKHRRGDDDDDDDDDSNDRGGSRIRGGLGVRTHQSRVPSPLQHHESSIPDEERGAQGDDGTSGGSKTALHTPSRPSNGVDRRRKFRYCTQACLLGVARGHRLDYKCPNVSSHKNPATNYNLEHFPHLDVHPIPRGRFSELVRLQLRNNLERDCTCFVDMGYSGAIGYLFKITLTGFGYTFVAKGVESYYHPRLVHETHIYQDLSGFQGRLVPVHLGLIKLEVEYPMVNFVTVTHMMLLSYAGLSLHSDRLERRAARLGLDVDWDTEAERTAQELEAAGLVDEDDNEANMMWCEDTQRVMRIDFDQAYVTKP